MVIAVLDGEGEGRGRGAAEQGAGAHEKSVGSARPVIECGGDTKCGKCDNAVGRPSTVPRFPKERSNPQPPNLRISVIIVSGAVRAE